VQVIFPDNVEVMAQRVANIIEHLYDSNYYSIGNQKKKVSIILQNQSITPNGFVTVGPFRSEFYTTAPQNNFGGTVDWIDMLSIHEYRHVQQLANARKGISKLGYWLYGEYGWSVVAHTALPPWYFEGDATFTETNLTNSGRGRQPNFEGQYRAILLTGQKIGYEKNSAGSFKDFIPNIYNMGYHLSTALRRNHGDEVLDEIVNDAVRFKGLIYPFSRSMKKITGNRTPKFYKQTIAELKSDWEAKASTITKTPSRQINTKKKSTFTNYRNAHFLNDSTIIVDKSGFNQIPTYYKLDLMGVEKRILNPGIYSRYNASLSLNQNAIYWTENAFDPRWGNVEYSNIIRYDLFSHTKSQLTQRSKYFASEISPDERKLVAVHNPDNQIQALHILNQNGSVIKRIENAQGVQYAFPTWIDAENIAVIVKRNSQNAIQKININTSTVTTLTPFWNETIAYLKYSGDNIYFSGIFNGIDNIYVIRMKDKQVFQVTSTLFGATQPDVSPNGKSLIYSEYTKNGYDLKIARIDTDNWIELASSGPSLIDYYKPVAKSNILSEISTTEHVTNNFKKTDRLRLHSWSPWYFHPNIGIVLTADNKMSTLSANANYTYNLNENRSSWGAGIDFAQFYPVLSLDYRHSRRNRFVPVYLEIEEDGEKKPDVKIYQQEWIEDDLAAGVTLPLNLSTGNFQNRIWITNVYHERWVDYINDETSTDGYFGTYELEVKLGAVRRRAYQQLNPRLGFEMGINYHKTIGVVINDSYSFLVNSTFYLPGITRNHSLYLEADYHAEPFAAQYKFSDNFSYARGYDATIHDNMTRFGVNYSLPLLYPDLAGGPVIFLKRIKSNLFLDYSVATIENTPFDELTALTSITINGLIPQREEIFSSVGAELTFDFRLLRGADVDMGVRYSYLLNATTDVHQFDVIISSLSF
jgi:Tol biopolymer transport system component